MCMGVYCGPRKPRAAKKTKVEEKPATTGNQADKVQTPASDGRKDLAHELVDMIEPDMTDEQKNAVWTLVLYLKSKEPSGQQQK
jgi:hypothetical protein